MPQQRLELTWIGKGDEPQLEPRLLIEDPDKSYGDADTNNLLIHGDNLLALKALEQEYAGKVKCVYIDPPYNTGNAFEQYDDGLEHSLWLNLIHQRITRLKDLLSDDGSLWISIDDVESHYLKVMCDEIFGRSCFIANVIWKKRDGPPNDRTIAAIHENILVYGKKTIEKGKRSRTLAELNFNLSPRTEKANKAYKVYKEPSGPDPKGPFRKIDTTANAKGGRHSDALVYPVLNPYTGKEVYPRKGTNWRHNKKDMQALQDDGRLFWGVDGKASTPMRKLYITEVRQGMTTPTIWDSVGYNQHASSEMEKIFGSKGAFDTPKPESLINLILSIASNPGDLVLDSFLGSGTTAAVAHKMGRRWIGIELGEHANTHCLPRLKKVVDGLDEGGITKAQNWQGGGGFKFYNLAPSLLRKDDLGQWVIDEAYNADQLAAAMAKHEGYTYAPDTDRYWKQAYSTENDYLYTTTQLVTPATVDHILEQLGPEESLLICCKAYQAAAEARDPRVNLHKIPSILTDRCEFGKDDYSLNIVDAPKDEEAPEFVPAGQQAAREAEAEELRKYGKQKGMFD